MIFALLRMSGTVTLQLLPGDTGGCEVRLGLELAAGSLPFPLAVSEVVAAVATVVRSNQPEVVSGADEQSLSLRFAGASVTFSYEA